MNLATAIIGLIVLAIFVLAVRSVLKSRKNGNSCSCGCGCDGCSGKSLCHPGNSKSPD